MVLRTELLRECGCQGLPTIQCVGAQALGQGRMGIFLRTPIMWYRRSPLSPRRTGTSIKVSEALIRVWV